MNRRDFLGSIACALAVAAVPCRIPMAAIVEPALEDAQFQIPPMGSVVCQPIYFSFVQWSGVHNPASWSVT